MSITKQQMNESVIGMLNAIRCQLHMYGMTEGDARARYELWLEWIDDATANYEWMDRVMADVEERRAQWMGRVARCEGLSHATALPHLRERAEAMEAEHEAEVKKDVGELVDVLMRAFRGSAA